MAGEVAAVGSAVTRFKREDRVCANFALDHVDGDPTPATKETCLGSGLDGVLAEYRVFPEHVRVPPIYRNGR